MSVEVFLAAGILVLLAVSLEAGFRLGRRAVVAREAPSGGQVGAIQGATLGLLGLLLGFSFAGAAARFLERQDLIVREANAIGTAYLRADLLDEPHRSDLKESLATYTRHRLAISPTLRHGLSPQAKTQIQGLHDQIWKAASAGVSEKPAAMIAVLNPVNEVIDLHADRVAASRKHLPILVLVLLVVCSALAMGVIGYGCGLSKRRCLMMTVPLAVLIAAALWTTIDLDYPRSGLILLDDSSLQDLDLGRAAAMG